MATVYLSSTYEDLKDHRAAVALMLRRAGHAVIGMEDYAAFDERPRDKCVADVMQSDLYVGIFAWRFGFVPTDANPSGASITQLEYEAAREGTRLVFLLSKDAPWRPEYIDAFNTPESAGRVAAMRDRMVKAHGTNFFVTPEELAAKVLAAVSAHAATSALPQTIRHMQRHSWRPPPTSRSSARARPAGLPGRSSRHVERPCWASTSRRHRGGRRACCWLRCSRRTSPTQKSLPSSTASVSSERPGWAPCGELLRSFRATAWSRRLTVRGWQLRRRRRRSATSCRPSRPSCARATNRPSRST